MGVIVFGHTRFVAQKPLITGMISHAEHSTCIGEGITAVMYIIHDLSHQT